MMNNSSYPNYDMTSMTDKYVDLVVIIISTILCVGGFFGNFVIACVVLKRKKMQTATNWFVLNLAISDMAIIVITIPFWILLRRISFPFGEIGCKYLVMPMMEHFAGVCVLTHTAVGVARYIIVKNSQRTRRSISDLQVKVTVALIWIIAFMFLSAPLMGILGEFQLKHNNNNTHCELQWHNKQSDYAYRMMTFTLTYVIPMVATGFSYFKIHQVVGKSLKCLNGNVSAEMYTTRQRQTSQMNMILMTMYILFAITTLPLQLFFCLHTFMVIPVGAAWAPVTMNGLFVLFYCQVVINPIVLFYMGENYRKEIYNLSICFCYKESKLIDITQLVRGKFKISDQHCKGRAPTRTTILAENSGMMHLTSIEHIQSDKNGKKNKICNNVQNASDVNSDNVNEFLSINLMETENSELICGMDSDVKDMKAYYDDGTLMYIYDKTLGCVSLVHDNGRETSI